MDSMFVVNTERGTSRDGFGLNNNPMSRKSRRENRAKRNDPGKEE